MITENKEYNEKHANELASELMDMISKFILDVHTKNSLLKYFYEKMGWETETSFIIEEALEKLGVSLASLVMDLKIDNNLMEPDNSGNN